MTEKNGESTQQVKHWFTCIVWTSRHSEGTVYHRTHKATCTSTNNNKCSGSLPSAFRQQTFKVSTQAFLSSSFSAVIRYALLLGCATSNVCSGYLSGAPISFSSTSETFQQDTQSVLIRTLLTVDVYYYTINKKNTRKSIVHSRYSIKPPSIFVTFVGFLNKSPVPV